MRLSILKQDHYAYDNVPVLKTVLMGNERLFKVMEEKDLLYTKADFSEEDGVRASESRNRIRRIKWLGGRIRRKCDCWQAWVSPILYMRKLMKELDPGEKVKVLLAQAPFLWLA